MATQSQQVPPAAQTVKTIVDVQIVYSDGTSEWIDTNAVKALSWYAAPINKTKPHSPGTHEPNIPSKNAGGSTGTMTTMTASSTTTSTTTDDEQRGTCWWDGQNWVCY